MRNWTPALLGLAALACVSAERRAAAAVVTAEEALSQVEPDASPVLPRSVQALRDTVTQARERLAAGSWDLAHALAVNVPAHASSLAASLPQVRTELQMVWDTLSVAMPRNLEAIRTRAEEVARSRRYPPGLDAARLQEIRRMRDSAVAEWEDIGAQWERGEMGAAVDRAFDLKARVSGGMVALGLVADDRAWGNARPIGP